MDVVVRKVAQDVMMFVWHEQGVIDEKPRPKLSFVPEITAEFLNNLCLSVRIDSWSNQFIWAEYCKKHSKRMTDSPYLFANYVYHACDILNQSTTNAYEGFCDTLSLMTHFVLHCWQEESEKFLYTCVDLFCAFFEKEIRTKFVDQGGWQNFNEYLVENHENLKRYKELIRTNQPELELFKDLENAYRRCKEPHVIGGVVLKDITESQVEENEEAVRFADSVLSKMLELFNQTLKEVVADFAKTDSRLEELYRKTVGRISDAEQSCLQKDQEDFGVKPNKKDDVEVKASEGERSMQKVQEDVDANEEEQSSLQKDPEDVDANEEEQSSLQKDPEDVDAKANEEEQSSLQKDPEDVDAKEEEQSSLKKDQDVDVKESEGEQSSPKKDQHVDVKVSEGEQSSTKKDQDVDVKVSEGEQSTSQGDQEEALGNIASEVGSKKNKHQKDPLESLDLKSSKSEDFGQAPQESDPSPKSKKEEMVKILLKDMMGDIDKLSELIKYVCKQDLK